MNYFINTLMSGLIQAVRKITAGPHVALCQNISAPVRVTDLVQVSKDTTILLVCTRKKYFCCGVRVCCEWRHKWRTFWFGHLGQLHLDLGANR